MSGGRPALPVHLKHVATAETSLLDAKAAIESAMGLADTVSARLCLRAARQHVESALMEVRNSV